MKRWAAGLAIVLAFLGAGLWWLYTSLDFVVKTTIERFAPEIVGAAVTVRGVSLSPRDGRGMLHGIEVGNPPGYGSPRALRAGTVAVGVDPATLAADVVAIRDILVDAPEITYELKGGTSNLEEIQRNIEAYVKRSGGGAGGKGGDGARKPGRRYVVGRVTIRGARVTMTNPALKGGDVTFDLPDVDVRDIGRRQGGVTAAEAARVVTAALVSRIAQKILTSADLLRRGGLDGALDALRGLVR
jgi:hypothetical protein